MPWGVMNRGGMNSSASNRVKILADAHDKLLTGKCARCFLACANGLAAYFSCRRYSTLTRPLSQSLLKQVVILDALAPVG